MKNPKNKRKVPAESEKYVGSRYVIPHPRDVARAKAKELTEKTQEEKNV